MLTARSRLVSRFATSLGSSAIKFHASAFLESLLLFDSIVLRSVRLLEIPRLIELLGYGDLVTLLKSTDLKLHSEAVTLADTGRLTMAGSYRVTKGPLPLGSFALHLVQQSNPAKDLNDYIRDTVGASKSLSRRQRLRLEALIRERLTHYPSGIPMEVLDQSKQDLTRNDPMLTDAIERLLAGKHDLHVPRGALQVSVRRLDDTDFRVDNNLRATSRFSEVQVHALLWEGISALVERNWRIADMKAFTALPSLRTTELPLFEAKFGLLAAELDPTAMSRQLLRVLELKGLPSFDEAVRTHRLDVNKLLRAREDPSVAAFRTWLWSNTQKTDDEVLQAMSSFRTRVGTILEMPLVRSIRFLVGQGLGLVPGWGLPAGMAYAGLDAFLRERAFPPHEPIAFANELLPSLFSRLSAGR